MNTKTAKYINNINIFDSIVGFDGSCSVDYDVFRKITDDAEMIDLICSVASGDDSFIAVDAKNANKILVAIKKYKAADNGNDAFYARQSLVPANLR